MVLEVAFLNIKCRLSCDFEVAFEKAQQIIVNIDGYSSHQLKKCVEQENKYLLLVNWNTIEDQEVGFRKSPEYQDWKALVHHFYDPFPIVEHYT